MKGLKIFGWICFGMALACLIPGRIIDFVAWSWDWFYDEAAIRWLVVSLIFLLSAILSWLVSRALKEIKNDLELKMLMNA